MYVYMYVWLYVGMYVCCSLSFGSSVCLYVFCCLLSVRPIVFMLVSRSVGQSVGRWLNKCEDGRVNWRCRRQRWTKGGRDQEPLRRWTDRLMDGCFCRSSADNQSSEQQRTSEEGDCLSSSSCRWTCRIRDASAAAADMSSCGYYCVPTLDD